MFNFSTNLEKSESPLFHEEPPETLTAILISTQLSVLHLAILFFFLYSALPRCVQPTFRPNTVTHTITQYLIRYRRRAKEG